MTDITRYADERAVYFLQYAERYLGAACLLGAIMQEDRDGQQH